MKYSIDEKECDDTQAVDLNEYGSYLLIPTKFIDREINVRLQERLEINKRWAYKEVVTSKYEINWQNIYHQQARAKGVTFDASIHSKRLFFGIVYPSGRINQVEVYRIDKTHKTLKIYTINEFMGNVTVKNL